MTSDAKTKTGASRLLADAWTEEELACALPIPAGDANKYSRGVLTMVVGSKRYPGAAVLASCAALRTGAGYTEVVAPKAARTLLLTTAPSLVVRDLDDWRPEDIACRKLRSKEALCIGPGFDADDPKTDKLVCKVLEHARCPVLVDGGALNALGTKKGLRALVARSEAKTPTVITPHGGEAERLRKALELRPCEPSGLCAALAMATGTVVVLKGPDTFVSNGKRVVPMYEGGSALAKAGTGDVLAGMISALLAQGLDPVAAAVLGTTLHARAGIAATHAHTSIGATTEDVLNAIPDALRTLDARI